MKKNILALLFLVCYSGMVLAESEIVVVQSARVLPYENALNGFLSISELNCKRFILSESKASNPIKDIKKINPPLILAIGHDALLYVKKIKDIPVIYIMVLDSQTISDNFYGISMNVNAELQLDILTESIPGINNIGIVYNPDKTGEFVRNAAEAAEKKGVRVITIEASKAGDIPRVIKGLHEIGAFWMLPDASLMTPDAIEFLLVTSIEKKIPLLSFSDKYVEMGALVSIAIDPYDIGKQAGEIAQKIFDGNTADAGKKIFARKGITTFNRKIAKKLGAELNNNLSSDIRVVE